MASTKPYRGTRFQGIIEGSGPLHDEAVRSSIEAVFGDDLSSWVARCVPDQAAGRSVLQLRCLWQRMVSITVCSKRMSQIASALGGKLQGCEPCVDGEEIRLWLNAADSGDTWTVSRPVTMNDGILGRLHKVHRLTERKRHRNQSSVGQTSSDDTSGANGKAARTAEKTLEVMETNPTAEEMTATNTVAKNGEGPAAATEEAKSSEASAAVNEETKSSDEPAPAKEVQRADKPAASERPANCPSPCGLGQYGGCPRPAGSASFQRTITAPVCPVYEVTRQSPFTKSAYMIFLRSIARYGMKDTKWSAGPAGARIVWDIDVMFMEAEELMKLNAPSFDLSPFNPSVSEGTSEGRLIHTLAHFSAAASGCRSLSLAEACLGEWERAVLEDYRANALVGWCCMRRFGRNVIRLYEERSLRGGREDETAEDHDDCAGSASCSCGFCKDVARTGLPWPRGRNGYYHGHPSCSFSPFV